MYLVDSDGHTAGPFAWTLIREWVAFGLLSSDSQVSLEGDSTWKKVDDFPELRQLPRSLATQGRFFGYYLSDDRLKLPSLSCQHSYAKALGYPFEPDQIDRHLLTHIIWSLSCQFPERVDRAVAADVEDASGWQNDPATDLQKSYLRSIGVSIDVGLTKGRVSQLIDGEPTEGQLRRLSFYGIKLTRYLTKKEASELIDSYKTQHPESEDQYQAWKISRCPV
jgi:hypothetical protein